MASDKVQLSWIGLGNMGRGMAKNLVSKGKLTSPLKIHNRTSAKAESFQVSLPDQASNLKISKTLSDAIEFSDIVFICLGDDAAVQETIEAILSMDVIGKLIVDCSTVHPSTTDKLAKSVAAHGASFVACPVFGAPAMADAGQLICVLAGPSKDVDRVKPYTTGVMARAIIDLSDQPHGKASLLKVIGNTFILNMIESLSEGHVLAEKSGLGVDNLQQFVEIMFPGPYTAYSNRLKSGDYYKREQPLFAVDLARKDARHAMDLAKASGARMRDVEVADGHLQDVQEHMGSKGDIAGIYGAVRKESGLKFENLD